MLHPFDDYPLHQTGRPLLHSASHSSDHFDRYFFNGYSRDGSMFFAATLAVYPNRDVIDAAFSVALNGEQISVMASGRAPSDRNHTLSGPIRVEILEPMRLLRITVQQAEGLAAELTFQARSVAVEEPHYFRSAGADSPMDYTRLVQWGAWQGWVSVDGVRRELEPTNTWGSRSRSWGVRLVGEATGRGAPSRTLPQQFRLSAPLNFEDCVTSFDCNEDTDGRRWHSGGSIIPLIAGRDAPTVDPGGIVEPLRTIDYAIDWELGTRRAQSCSIILQPWRGDTEIIRLEPLLTFQMVNLGYGHLTWNHGTWQGEDEVRGERIRPVTLDPTAPENLHVQQLCRATWGRRRGMGVLEQVALGEHQPTGLIGFTEGAS